MKIIIEYDNDKLKNIIDKLYKLFLNNNYEVELLNNSLSQNEKNTIINNDNNYFLLSNKINNNNSLEIIYPLKDNNSLAILLNDKLPVNKFYQLRSPINTNLDYYEIFRYLKNNKGIIIKYNGNSLNDNTVNLIYQVISNYLNNENIYIVKSGDSLYSIAKKFNTSVDELKKINNLSSNLLSINQKLVIPKNNINNDNNSNITTENIYIVKSGDSLYRIAIKFNTTADELKRINNLSSNNLSIGQKLIIPSNNSEIVYTVIKGDSLYSISKKYNTTVNEIKKINNLSNNNLSIGQKLIIKK